MSAAAAQRVIVIPEAKQRSWATLAIVAIDILALELALLFGCLVRILLQAWVPIGLGRPQYEGLALGILTLPLIYYWVGLYPGYGMGAVQRLRTRVYATFTVFVVLLVWNYVFQDRQWSRGVLLSTLVFALILPPAMEALARKVLIARGVFGLPVIILGAGETGALVAGKLRRQSELGFVPMGLLDDDPTKWGTSIQGVPILGPLSAVSAFEGKAKVALIAMPGLNRHR
ncbi:MAG: exopolysaccharide biosynthesis polyprenyl glycosylphosphotransferase, partial [Bryobacteraceae bacterium]